jgi:hypothetical protein
MTFKITVQDEVSDLFEVIFKWDYVNALSQYVKTEPIVNAQGEITGSRYIMKHTDLAGIMTRMAM